MHPGYAASMAAAHYGLQGEIQPLPSYIDFNFKLQTASGSNYVIKFASPGAELALLEMENAAMRHLQGKNLPFSHPTLLTSLNREQIVAVANSTNDGTGHCMRVITWLDGMLFAKVSARTAALHESLGALLASSAIAFADFEHPAAHRHFKWDIAQLADLKPLLAVDGNKGKYDQLTCHLDNFCANILPALRACPRQIIHNDGNDHNLLTTAINGRTTCSGLIDFGDMVYSYRVFDLAIAMAYALFGQNDVPAAAQAIVKGYEQQLALQPAEKDNLYYCIVVRLVQSLLLSAQSYQANPQNEYLLISAQPAWELLKFLHGFGADRFCAALSIRS